MIEQIKEIYSNNKSLFSNISNEIHNKRDLTINEYNISIRCIDPENTIYLDLLSESYYKFILSDNIQITSVIDVSPYDVIVTKYKNLDEHIIIEKDLYNPYDYKWAKIDGFKAKYSMPKIKSNVKVSSISLSSSDEIQDTQSPQDETLNGENNNYLSHNTPITTQELISDLGRTYSTYLDNTFAFTNTDPVDRSTDDVSERQEENNTGGAEDISNVETAFDGLYPNLTDDLSQVIRDRIVNELQQRRGKRRQ